MAEPERRWVLDTNTLVSAVLLKRSIPAKALDKAVQKGHLLASTATLTEFAEVLLRTKFDRYLARRERLDFILSLADIFTFVEPAETIRACRDPKDDKFLEVAVSGEAGAIVSGDEDLLILHPFRGISIIGPRAFVEESW